MGFARAIVLFVAAASVLGACLSFGDLSGGEPSPDGGADAAPSIDASDAAVDATKSDSGIPIPTPDGGCDFNAAFGAPTPFSINSANDDWSPRLSPDQLFVYFASSRVPHGDGGAGLFFASRTIPSGDFSGVALIDNVNGPYVAVHPTVTADGRTLLFQSDEGGAGNNIYFTTRSTTLGDFAAPAIVAGINTATAEENAPYVTPDGSALYFARKPSGSVNQLYRAVLSGGGFTSPTAVSELNTAFDSSFPAVTPDELTIYWASNQTGTLGSYDIWTAQRSSTTDSFGSIRNIGELNSSAEEFPSWISADNCTLYFMSNTTGPGSTGGLDMYVASRKQ